MIWCINQLQLVLVSSYYDCQRLVKTKFYLSPSVAAPCVCCIFLCCDGAVSKHQVLFQSLENGYRNVWNAWNQLWTRSSVYYVCLANGLKESETDMRTLTVIQVVCNCQLLKIQKQLQIFMNCQLTFKLVEYRLHVKWEIICHIIHDNLGKRKIYTKCVSHSLWDKHRVATCEDLSRFIRPSHSVLIAKLLRQVVGFRYNPQTQCHSMMWRIKSSLRYKQFACRSWSKWCSPHVFS
jgi:hypothetical protein